MQGFTSSSRYYRAYGLNIRSELDIAELRKTAPCDVDVIVEAATVDGPMPENGETRLIHLEENSGYLAWPFFGRFRTLPPGRIIADIAPGAGPHAGLALLGPVFAALLHQRGVFLLHGSAVEIDGKAALFVGWKGAGKSTLAAAFVADGHTLVSDDVIAIRFADCEIPSVASAYPSMKLSPDAQRAILPDASLLVAAADMTMAKRRVVVELAKDAVPIGSIFVVQARDGQPLLSKVGHLDALRMLIEQCYAIKFGEMALAGSGGTRAFEGCARLSRDCAVWKTTPPERLEHLPAFVKSIVEEHRRS